MLDPIKMNLLKEVAYLDSLPTSGAFNIRVNGQLETRNSTANVEIVSKKDKPGIDIFIKPGTKNESVHIPVVLDQSGLFDTVYNDFYVGDNSDVVIIAGCGISNCGNQDSGHDGIHSFHIGNNCNVRYYENHYGINDGAEGRGKRIMNPTTLIDVGEDSTLNMETSQIGGVDDAIRNTKGKIGARSKLVIKDKILTAGDQRTEAFFTVDMDGDDSSCNLISRSVAKDHSWQHFDSKINGNTRCAGHSECDSIIMGDACVLASPELTANHVDAALIHEAAIGKIAGAQLIKLQTLGLTEEEAEEQIVAGFLR